VIARKPIEGRVQDNLRKWKTGGWRRPSEERPFGDVIRSSPTTQRERKICKSSFAEAAVFSAAACPRVFAFG